MHKKIIKYLFLLTFLLFINNLTFAQVTDKENEKVDSAVIVNDSIATDSIKNERLEDILTYSSDDQVHEWKKKMSYLLRNAVIKYLDMEIDADYIEINWETGDVFADGKRDSVGKMVVPTIFKQGGKEYEQYSFKLNFNTKVGTAYNVRINQDDGVLIGDRVKRINDSIMFVRSADYTTDTYFIQKKTDDPDYVLRTSRAKFIDSKNKILITGPINMRIYDVPTPLTLPFSYIPLGEKRAAGIIIPSFGERADVGFFLEGMGFYLPIGEHIDLSLTGEIYTKGSWGLHFNSNYRKRYKYRGSFRFDYENRVMGILGLDDYSRMKNYRLNWHHSQDPKANPNLIFTADVNMNSSQFFRESINNNNIFNGDVFTNTTSSSVALNKIFPNSPFTLAVVASHHQNNKPGSNEPASMQFVLPQMTFIMSRVHPFASKAGGNKSLLNNLAVGYNMNLVNKIDTDENDAFTSRMWDKAKNGAKHRFDLVSGTSLGPYFPVTFGAYYDEVWYMKTFRKEFDEELNQVVTTEVNGFDSYRDFGVSMGISTNIYGTFISKKEGAMIKGIRHVISPTIGMGFRPDFSAEEWEFFDYYRGPDGKKVLYSRFQDGVFGAPQIGGMAAVSFGLRNNLEMKVRSKTDSTGYQKVKIFEFLDITSAYNMVADEFRLAPVNVSGMTKLFNQKLNLQFRAAFDPYKIMFANNSETGTRINELGAFRLTDYSVNFGYNFDNKTFGNGFDSSKYSKRGEIRDENFYFDEYDYAHFSIPWRLSLNFVHNYSRGLMRKGINTTVVNISTSISPSPYWTLSTSTSYDFSSKKLSEARISFNRDLRSFTLNFSWVPFGQFKTWDFFFGIKANILKDAVKYDERASNRLRGGDF